MKYRVSGLVTISIYTDVEAESVELAITEAGTRQMQGFCHQCVGGDADAEWSITGDLDGEPCDLRAEEADSE